jgi:hypothetical protein
MPYGKAAGAGCANLNSRNERTLYGKAERPAFCVGWPPMPDACGHAFEEAMTRITALERATA